MESNKQDIVNEYFRIVKRLERGYKDDLDSIISKILIVENIDGESTI